MLCWQFADAGCRCRPAGIGSDLESPINEVRLADLETQRNKNGVCLKTAYHRRTPQTTTGQSGKLQDTLQMQNMVGLAAKPQNNNVCVVFVRQISIARRLCPNYIHTYILMHINTSNSIQKI